MSKTFVVEFVVCLVVGGCGSSSSTSSTLQANPCATKGATYEVSFSEQASGTCGPLPQSIINVSSDGTVNNGTSLMCTSIETDGCTARSSGCTSTLSNGCTATLQTDITFSSDGTTASGLESFQITCPNGSSCASSYNVSAQRQ